MSFSLGLYKQSPNEKERPNPDVEDFTLDGGNVLIVLKNSKIKRSQNSTSIHIFLKRDGILLRKRMWGPLPMNQEFHMGPHI
jgi:hypothetical protein